MANSKQGAASSLAAGFLKIIVKIASSRHGFLAVAALLAALTPLGAAAFTGGPGASVPAAMLVKLDGSPALLAAPDGGAPLSSSLEDRVSALIFMGAIYGLYLDQHQGAVQYYDRVMASYPHTASASESLFNNGALLFSGDDPAQARQACIRVLSLYPEGRSILSGEAFPQLVPLEAAPEDPLSSELFSLGGGALRILLETGQPAASISAGGGFSCLNPRTGKVLFEGGDAVFTVSHGKLHANGDNLGVVRCCAAPKGLTAALNGRDYRGVFMLHAANGGVGVTNHVDVETYLYGVLPREMHPDWPVEALKAQAVAARSYALHLKEKRRRYPFDLLSTTASQVYGGYDSKFSKAIQAVDDTRGQVVTYDGRTAVAYYHANSGGCTESAGAVWVKDLPYLKAKTDPYSPKAPGTRWKCTFSAGEVQKALARSGLQVDGVTDLRPEGRSPSGRALRVQVVSKDGALSLKSNLFRLMMGASRLKSTRFSVEENGGAFTFRGTGFGHGVGMSQWGARDMARSGADYTQILSFYYDGVKIQTLDYALHAASGVVSR